MRLSRVAAVLLVVLGSAGCGCPDVRVRVVSDGEQRLNVCAPVARTAQERRRGLMGHAPLGEGEGLLIAFPHEGDEVCIVNDGVDFPIDAVFAAADGRVVAVERAIAAGDETLRCHGPTRRVLEVAAGVASGVERGDRLAAGSEK